MAEQKDAQKAAPAKSSRVVDTWKMKKWYKIMCPKLFGSEQIGETIAAEDSMLIGRTIKVSLAQLTNDSKKQNTNVIFEINEVKSGVAETATKKMEIAPSSIRRMIRKGKDRVDLSMICATKDNVVVRIKPFLVTRAKVGNSVMTRMRNTMDALLRNDVIKGTYDDAITDIVTGKLQRRIKQVLNRIYPLKTVEIRSFERTDYTGTLPPIPKFEDVKEEVVELTEEEKLEKKVKSKKSEEIPEEIVEEKAEKKSKSKKAAKEEA